jgi:hypothetical protein
MITTTMGIIATKKTENAMTIPYMIGRLYSPINRRRRFSRRIASLVMVANATSEQATLEYTGQTYAETAEERAMHAPGVGLAEYDQSAAPKRSPRRAPWKPIDVSSPWLQRVDRSPAAPSWTDKSFTSGT